MASSNEELLFDPRDTVDDSLADAITRAVDPEWPDENFNVARAVWKTLVFRSGRSYIPLAFAVSQGIVQWVNDQLVIDLPPELMAMQVAHSVLAVSKNLYAS